MQELSCLFCNYTLFTKENVVVVFYYVYKYIYIYIFKSWHLHKYIRIEVRI